MIIDIKDYPLNIRIGYSQNERLLPQDVLVNLEVHLPTEINPGKEDDLKQTIDYAELLGILEERLAGEEIGLIETVVERIGTILLEHFALIKRVDVSVRKPSIPDHIARGAKISVSKVFDR